MALDLLFDFVVFLCCLCCSDTMWDFRDFSIKVKVTSYCPRSGFTSKVFGFDVAVCSSKKYAPSFTCQSPEIQIHSPRACWSCWSSNCLSVLLSSAMRMSSATRPSYISGYHCLRLVFKFPKWPFSGHFLASAKSPIMLGGPEPQPLHPRNFVPCMMHTEYAYVCK